MSAAAIGLKPSRYRDIHTEALPFGPEYIGRNLEDAVALKNGKLKGEKHPVMPRDSCKGKWTEYYYG